ncbi:Concanavalin A-like lectin protein kinase family protein [Perilla frutescens var. frutescens]|nr:Concanavalin A-like lectin protein kinase family protein [Perilla frutescens var. frutescens]
MGLEEEDFSDSSMDHEFEKATGPRKFSYKELVLATDNFADEHKLGQGGFGGVYRGFLEATNTYIAVKRVSKESKQGRKEYAAEVKIISQLRHVNLVQLIGWCHQRTELLLVYEFMPNESLDTHIFKLNSQLTWELRYRIAQGLASALLYLHEGLRQYVVHMDIKVSNIMLDADFNAKLGDFGLARLVDHDKNSQTTTVLAGTLGYMAPEYRSKGRASKETDIFSFGIVLLEIACGRRPIVCIDPQNEIMLVEWVWNLYGAGQLLDAADLKLDSSEDDTYNIERLMVVGLWRAHPYSNQRPSIRHVMQVLNFEAPLPEPPLVMPIAVYNNPRVATASSTDSVISEQCSNPSNITTSSVGSTSELLPK